MTKQRIVVNVKLNLGQLIHGEFWSEGQRQFLQSHIDKDDDWAIVIDELNQQLHIDSNPKT